MLRSLWALLALLGNIPNPEDLPSSDPDRGHGMDPNG